MIIYANLQFYNLNLENVEIFLSYLHVYLFKYAQSAVIKHMKHEQKKSTFIDKLVQSRTILAVFNLLQAFIINYSRHINSFQFANYQLFAMID